MVQCPVIFLCVDKSLLNHFSLLIKLLCYLVVRSFLTCTAIYWYEWRSFTRLQRAIKMDRSTALCHTLALFTAHAPTHTCCMWTCLACFTQAWSFVYHIKGWKCSRIWCWGLLGCYVLYLGSLFPTTRRNAAPSFLGLWVNSSDP